MNLTNRQQEIVRYLIKQVGYKPVKYYADLFDVSERMIYYDLKNISTFFKYIGYELVQDHSRGITLNKLYTKNNNIDQNVLILLTEKEERLVKILKKILINSEKVTYEGLALDLFVSSTSIKNDISIIEKEYLSKDVKVKSDKSGTKIIGKNSEIITNIYNLNETLLHKITQIYPRSEIMKQYYCQTYGEKVYKTCFEILIDHITDEADLIDEYCLGKILNILISVSYRLSLGYNVEPEYYEAPHHQKFCKNNSKIIQFAEMLLSSVSDKLDFNYNISDILLLAIFLKSNKIPIFTSHINNSEEEIIQLVSNVQNLLGNDLISDQILINQLRTHFPAMINRIKNNIICKNNFSSQIKEDYFMLYKLVSLSLYNVEEKYNIKVNDDEICFLVIFFQIALERQKSVKKVLVICPLGISTSTFLTWEIQKILPPIDVVKSASARNLEGKFLNKFDLIISTSQLDLDYDYVLVSPILDEEDKKNVLSKYNEIEVKGYENELNIIEKSSEIINKEFPQIEKYLSEDRIFCGKNFDTKEEILDYIFSELEGKCFNREFINSVIDREYLGETSFSSGISIPHGDPKNVIESGITILVNSKKIKWSENYVYVVILLHISEFDLENVKYLLNEIYAIINDKSKVDLIFKNRSKSDLIDFFKH